jgi:nucleoid-associated protein YgaU
MQPLIKATLMVEWSNAAFDLIEVQFNPTELSFNKGTQTAEIAIPGLDAPLLQFVRGQAETLSMDLFCDSTDQGMGTMATSVTTYTDQFYQLVKIEPGRHAPPICTFFWNSSFPGNDISPNLGNQKRTSFRGIVDSVKHKYTLFSPLGVPLRATVTLSLKEYKTLDDQLAQLNLNSPNRTLSYVLQQGDTLSLLAERHYLRAAEWRRIADANSIDDPRRINPGLFLSLPPIE